MNCFELINILVASLVFAFRVDTYLFHVITTITYSGTGIVDVKSKIQGDINSLCKWMDIQLTINTNKTQFMIIASYHK